MKPVLAVTILTRKGGAMQLLGTIVTIAVVVAILAAAAWIFVLAPLVVPRRRAR